MTKHTFKNKLGRYHWERLVRLADFYGHTNKNEYAVTLLKRAIEESEMWRRSDLYSKYERQIQEFEEDEERLLRSLDLYTASNNGEMDDDLPF